MSDNYSEAWDGNPTRAGDKWVSSETNLPVIIGHGRAEALAKEDAARAIRYAREVDQPVEFITGNSYFPALRAFGRGDYVWHAENYGAWDTYIETFAGELDMADVYLGLHEDEGSAYVVDMKRFRYIEDNEAEDLNDEWERI